MIATSTSTNTTTANLATITNASTSGSSSSKSGGTSLDQPGNRLETDVVVVSSSTQTVTRPRGEHQQPVRVDSSSIALNQQNKPALAASSTTATSSQSSSLSSLDFFHSKNSKILSNALSNLAAAIVPASSSSSSSSSSHLVPTQSSSSSSICSMKLLNEAIESTRRNADFVDSVKKSLLSCATEKRKGSPLLLQYAPRLPIYYTSFFFDSNSFIIYFSQIHQQQQKVNRKDLIKLNIK